MLGRVILELNLDEFGEMSMYGKYNILNGMYNMRVKGLVKKDFSISEVAVTFGLDRIRLMTRLLTLMRFMKQTYLLSQFYRLVSKTIVVEKKSCSPPCTWGIN
jgi:hypothetical protein